MAKNKLTWKDVPDFEPALTSEQVEKFEKHAGGNGPGSVGMWRRLMLTTLARDRETLVKFATDGTDAFAECAEGIIEFKNHAKGLLKFAEVAEARMCGAAGIAAHRKECQAA